MKELNVLATLGIIVISLFISYIIIVDSELPPQTLHTNNTNIVYTQINNSLISDVLVENVYNNDVENNNDVELNDRKVFEIIAKRFVETHQYINETYTCSEYARDLTLIISHLGYNINSHMVSHYRDNSPHMINQVCFDEICNLWEPQTGTYVDDYYNKSEPIGKWILLK